VRIETCPATAEHERLWDAFAAGSAAASHCQLIGWRRVIGRSYGHPSFYLWALEGDAVRGILPLVFLRNRLFARGLVSMPFLDDGGPCAADPATTEALAAEALRLSERLDAEVVDLRNRKPSGLDLPAFGTKVTLRLGIGGGSEKLWARLDGKVRNQVRKGQKAGLSVEWPGRAGVRDFYDVFAVNMRDLGSPVHARALFEALFDEFPSAARLALVKKDGRTIGGAVCLMFRDTVQVPWASSLREFLSLCPNNVLYWEILRWAADAGYTCFDFGRSSPDSGTYKFKTQWGAVAEPLHWQLHSRKRKPALSESRDSSFSLAVRVWKRLPVGLTRVLGPKVRKHISL
jgi:FemAB-related protein (PEP-CTERM system-associated)